MYREHKDMKTLERLIGTAERKKKRMKTFGRVKKKKKNENIR